MLYYISGKVAILEPGLAVIDVNGVGYGCRITAYTAGQLKVGRDARLFITESIREDAFDLYGFSSREEQKCYELLTSVNGVGPKAAMSILSCGGPQNFTLAVMTGGVAGDPAAVAHAVYVDDGKTWLQNGHLAGNIVEHRKKSPLSVLKLSQQRGVGPGVTQGNGHGIGGVVGLRHGGQL